MEHSKKSMLGIRLLNTKKKWKLTFRNSEFFLYALKVIEIVKYRDRDEYRFNAVNN